MGPAKKERHRLALPLGYQLGSYQFQEQLGFGSFGITYLAYDQMLSRKVAIKELLPTMIATRCDTVRVEPHTSEDEEQWVWAQERFVAEAQTVAKCKHPNVLHVFEAFRANGTAYMVTQFEDGCTLTRWLKNLGRSPTESELRGILDPLLSALDTVHAQQFLHRDIKPDNIYMTAGNRPVLIDFGSARQDVTQRSVPMTAIVTEGYAPFEQYSENGRQGPWTDLYALAAVIYCAIVGHKPPSAAERGAAGEEDPCICLAAAYASQYSAGLLQSIDAGLRLNARSRPQSTAEWRCILSGSTPIRPEDTRTPTGFPVDSGPAPQSAPTPTESASGGQVAPKQGRVFQSSMVAALLFLAAAVVFLLVKINDRGNPRHPESETSNETSTARNNQAKPMADAATEQIHAQPRGAEEGAERPKIQQAIPLESTPAPIRGVAPWTTTAMPATNGSSAESRSPEAKASEPGRLNENPAAQKEKEAETEQMREKLRLAEEENERLKKQLQGTPPAKSQVEEEAARLAERQRVIEETERLLASRPTSTTALTPAPLQERKSTPKPATRPKAESPSPSTASTAGISPTMQKWLDDRLRGLEKNKPFMTKAAYDQQKHDFIQNARLASGMKN